MAAIIIPPADVESKMQRVKKEDKRYLCFPNISETISDMQTKYAKWAGSEKNDDALKVRKS